MCVRRVAGTAFPAWQLSSPTPRHRSADACLRCAARCCSGLRTLALEDIQCRLFREPLAELGRLAALERLSVCATQRHGVFIFGIDAVPDTWRHLGRLRSLELRCELGGWGGPGGGGGSEG